MRVIIAGSRSITDYKLVERAILESGWHDQISEVVCGVARGVDVLGMQWAARHGLPVAYFPVEDGEWKELGKRAGPARNRAMAKYANALILVWDGQSRGSADMLRKAKAQGLRIYEHKVNS